MLSRFQRKQLLMPWGEAAHAGGSEQPQSDPVPSLHPQSTCDPMPNHSETISHTVNVPLQATLGTLEEIAC